MYNSNASSLNFDLDTYKFEIINKKRYIWLIIIKSKKAVKMLYFHEIIFKW